MSHRRTIALGATVMVALFLLSLTRLGTYTADEVVFHFPNAVNFSQHGFFAALNSSYSAANTPLPYLLVALAAGQALPTLLLARAVTSLISFLAFVAGAEILAEDHAPPFLALGLLFSPYFFLNSVVYYAVNFGIAFFLLGVVLWGGKRAGGEAQPTLATGICLSLAALCQQFYVSIPLAMVGCLAFDQSRESDLPAREGLRRIAVSACLLLLPLVAPVLLFLQWHGLTHPNFRFHTIAFYPSTIVGMLFVAGFYSAPLALQSWRTVRAAHAAAFLGAAALLVALFRPEFSDVQGPGVFTGLTHHLIILTGVVHPVLPIAVMVLLTASGLFVIQALARGLTTAMHRTLFLSAAVLACVYATNTLIGEKHLLPFSMLLLLLTLPRLQRSWQRLSVGALAVLGLSYVVYWLFFKYDAM